MKKINTILLIIIIALFMSNCSEQAMTLEQKNAYLKKHAKKYNENEAKKYNITLDELEIYREESKKLGLTLYQYQDKLKTEERNKLLMETLNNIKSNNTKQHANINQNDLIKEQYNTNII